MLLPFGCLFLLWENISEGTVRYGASPGFRQDLIHVSKTLISVIRFRMEAGAPMRFHDYG